MLDRKHNNITFTIKDLEGITKEYSLIPLKQKTGAAIMHNVLQSILVSLSQVVKVAGSEDQAALVEGLAKVANEIGFDKFWYIAERVLKDAYVNNEVSIGDLNTTDYFMENPDELYLATFYGVLENWPKVFSKVRQALDGFSLSDTIAKFRTKPKEESEE